MHETLTTTRISWNPDFINATVAFYNVSINCGEIFSEDRVVNGTTMIVDVMNQLTSTSCKAKLRALTKNGDIVISYAAFSTLGMLLLLHLHIAQFYMVVKSRGIFITIHAQNVKRF